MGTPPGLGPLADHSSDIVVRFDRAMRHTYVNAAAEGASGRPRAELLGRTLEELGIAAEQCAFWHRELTRVFESGEPHAFAFEHETSGGRRYYESRMAPERDDGGSVVSAVIVTRDVTDRRTHARLFEAEKAARRRSDLLQRVAAGLSRALTAAEVARVVVTEARAAVGASASAVWLLDELTSELEMAAVDGYAGGAALLEPYRRLPLDADLPLCEAVRRKAPVLLESPEARRARYPSVGQPIGGFEAWAAIPLLTQDRVVGAAGLSFAEARAFNGEESAHLTAIGRQAAQAIERARLFEAEHRARTAAEELQSETAVLYRLSDVANRARSPEPVFEAALDAIRDVVGFARASVLLFDAAGVIRFRAWRGLSDEYREAVEGHSPWAPTTENPQPIVVADVRDDDGLAAFGPVFEREGIRALAFIPLVYGHRLLGKFMLYASEPRAVDARQIGKAGAIAAHVASAVGRAQSEDALRDANRRKDEFLAMLSHELRNPLAAARNAVHLLASVPGDGAARQRWLDVVDRQTANLVRLVDDLLDVSRITRGRIELRREDVDLRAIVQRALLAAAGALGVHRVSSALGDEPLMVTGDPLRLEQAFGNLLVNAGKYTPDGGEVSVSAARRDGEVVVAVKDTGIGIEAERLSRVFELFDQGGRDLARTQGGLGIGLTIVRGLVELHGGQVEARSQGAGRGSEFVVMLPEAGAGAAADSPSVAAAASASCWRVLVVDDHVDAADMLGVLLRAWGHTVDVVHDSAEVIPRARDFKPDVVLLDIGLPGLNGYDLARILRAEPAVRNATLIALTGYGQPSDRERALASGFSQHLVKPVQPEALRAALAVQPVS